jgi:hypothetical protein
MMKPRPEAPVEAGAVGPVEALAATPWGRSKAAGPRRLGPVRAAVAANSQARLLVLLLVFSLAAAAASPGRPWTAEQIERFLASAEIVSLRPLSEGVTNTVRATFSNGSLTHDAQIQQVDISKPSYPTAKGWELNFRDYWGYNVAAYRLSRLLNLDRVPVSVRREIDGKGAAVTWWIDAVLMTEKTRFLTKVRPPDVEAWNRQMYIVRVFDQLIYNTDRNLGNLVITEDWKIWMIDHTRAFRLHNKPEDPAKLVLCERGLLEAMRRLDGITLSRQLGEYLTSYEIEALLARRDRIVEHFDRQIDQRGEEKVLFDSAPP